MVALKFLVLSVGVQIPVSLPILSPRKRAFFGFIVIYRGHTTQSQMWRLFCWGGSTSVSTASSLEIR